VEYGSAEQVYKSPRHPYTQALLSAVPRPDPDGKRAKRTVLEGDIPSPLAKPTGCGFRTRCPLAKKECAEIVPELKDRGAEHLVACPVVD
jgi:oligopeptide/dipeptide ABC transporter ATP-binding protein